MSSPACKTRTITEPAAVNDKFVPSLKRPGPLTTLKVTGNPLGTVAERPTTFVTGTTPGSSISILCAAFAHAT